MKLSTFDIFKKLKPMGNNWVALEGDTLLKYQRVLLHMASEIIEAFEKHGICYQLSGGTALGAVRHHGFIPWDDDIDLNVLSSDMDKIQEMLKNEFGNKYCFQDCHDPAYGNVTGKIRLRGSVSRSREDEGMSECGFAIDLFPIENLFDNKVLYLIHGVLCMALGFCLSCRKFYEKRTMYRRLEKQYPEIRKVFETKIILGRIFAIMSVQKWVILTNKCYRLCRDTHSKKVGIPSGRGHYFTETYLRRGMINMEYIQFEDHYWKIATNYNEYLSKLFGPDYLQIPSKDKIEKHYLMELQFPDDIVL